MQHRGRTLQDPGHCAITGTFRVRGTPKFQESGLLGCFEVIRTLGIRKLQTVFRYRMRLGPGAPRFAIGLGPGNLEQVPGTSPQGPLGLRVPASRARVTSGSGREPSSVYFRPPAGLRPSEARVPRSHGLAHGVSGGGRRSAALRGAAANVGSVGRRAAGSRRGWGSGGPPGAAGCREAGQAGRRAAGRRERGPVPEALSREAAVPRRGLTGRESGTRHSRSSVFLGPAKVLPPK